MGSLSSFLKAGLSDISEDFLLELWLNVFNDSYFLKLLKLLWLRNVIYWLLLASILPCELTDIYSEPWSINFGISAIEMLLI